MKGNISLASRLKYDHECDIPRNAVREASLERHTVTGSSIQVVDDDPAFGDSTARVLRAAGFEVCLAPDYRLALEDLESTRPIDLLITDIVMPDRFNGIALSRMARMRRPGLKVICLTAYDIPGVEDEAIGPVLRKPIDDEPLLAEVRRVLADG
jgi:CheY-like chemotaxis protein